MNPFYICDTCGVYYAHKPNHCRMLMDENVYCSTPIKTAFCAEDLIKMLDERKKYLHAMVEKYKRNNLEDQYDAATHEIETILKELIKHE